MIHQDHVKEAAQNGYIQAMIEGVRQDISLGLTGKNNGLFKGVARLGGLIPVGLMTEQELTNLALAVTNLPNSEALPTIKSAIKAGKTSPFDLSRLNYKPSTRQTRRQQERFETKAKETQGKEQELIKQKQRWVVSLWNRGGAVPDWLTYLDEKRGLKKCCFENNIRFLQSLKYGLIKPASYWPVLLIAAKPAPTAKVESCFRLYLSLDGGNKAPLDRPKIAAPYKGLGHWVGNYNSDTLILCEGVENAYSLQLMRNDTPLICAAFSSGNMANISIPKSIKTVVLAGDNDKSGQDANRKTGNQLYKAGYVVKTIKPPMNKDWNDLLLETMQEEEI